MNLREEALAAQVEDSGGMMTRRLALFMLGAIVATGQVSALAQPSEARQTVTVQVYEAPS